jgi:uncharacterized protein (TIGR03435 family)
MWLNSTKGNVMSHRNVVNRLWTKAPPLRIPTWSICPWAYEEVSNKAGRVVVNKTGLTGRCDIKLEMPQPGQSNGAQDPGPSIFTVVQDQLGLKLEAAKGSSRTV